MPTHDIETDRLLMFVGAAAAGAFHPPFVPAATDVWVPYVLDGPEYRSGPHTNHALVRFEARVGTVAQLTEFFREGLTRVHGQMTEPTRGSANLPAVPGPVALPLLPDPTRYAAYMAPLYTRPGRRPPRQPAAERDLLMRLVALYDPRPDSPTGHPLPPDSDPARVQRLIDALTVLRVDAELAALDRAEAEQT